MLQELYWHRLQRFPLPSEEETIKFVHQFIGAHSWYKHLSWTEPTLFIFFISPITGEWSYAIPTESHNERGWFNGEEVEDEAELLTDKNHPSYFLPPDVYEIGKIGLTAFVHRCFETYELYCIQHQEQLDLLNKRLHKISTFIQAELLKKQIYIVNHTPFFYDSLANTDSSKSTVYCFHFQLFLSRRFERICGI